MMKILAACCLLCAVFIGTIVFSGKCIKMYPAFLARACVQNGPRAIHVCHHGLRKCKFASKTAPRLYTHAHARTHARTHATHACSVSPLSGDAKLAKWSCNDPDASVSEFVLENHDAFPLAFLVPDLMPCACLCLCALIMHARTHGQFRV